MSVNKVVTLQMNATNDRLEDKNDPHSDGVVIFLSGYIQEDD